MREGQEVTPALVDFLEWALVSKKPKNRPAIPPIYRILAEMCPGNSRDDINKLIDQLDAASEYQLWCADKEFSDAMAQKTKTKAEWAEWATEKQKKIAEIAADYGLSAEDLKKRIERLEHSRRNQFAEASLTDAQKGERRHRKKLKRSGIAGK
jgi:hypothetical protein